jgi:hypothetical protein
VCCPAHTWIIVVTDYAAYCDSSGHPDNQPYVNVAGFVASEEGWLDFEPAWKDALKRNKLETVFHMVDFEFAHRRDPKRGKILDELTTIITEHVSGAFSIIVDMKAYRRVNDVYTLEEAVGTPYAIAARAVARGMNVWRKNELTTEDHLLVFMEEGTKHKGDMEEAFRRDKLPLPQTVPKSHPSMQPGDMLAWEVFHHLKYHDDRRSLRKLVQNTMPYPEMEGTFLEHNLIETCKNANALLRSSVPPNVEIVYDSRPKRIRRRTIK